MIVAPSWVAGLIRADDDARPRSRQTMIGPSQLGDPCDRRLAYHALQVPHATHQQDMLAAWVGTNAHEGMARALTAHGQGWAAEVESVIPGYRIPAHIDAWHEATGTVVDWKFVGDSSLAKHRASMSPLYRAQVHLYGLALALNGHTVNTVNIVLIPRNGGLHRIHVWTEPYREQVAERVLDRWSHILTITRALGTAALPAISTSPAAHCAWCPWWDPVDGDTSHLGQGCPGHGRTTGASPKPWQPDQPQQQGATA